MPYKAKTTIAHHQYTCQSDQILHGCPPKLLKQFIKDGIVEMVGSPDEPVEGFEDTFEDCLVTMDRPALLAFIKRHNIHKMWVPMKNWSEEQIRMQVRQTVPDFNTLDADAAAEAAEAAAPVEDEEDATP